MEADAILGIGNKSLLIKLALEALLRAVARDGKVVLPLDWRELARSLDNRRRPEMAMVADGLPAPKAGTSSEAKTVYPAGPRARTVRKAAGSSAAGTSKP